MLTVDVPHHILPDFFWRETNEQHGPVGGIAPPPWSRESALAFMDDAGIDVAVTSSRGCTRLSLVGVDHDDPLLDPAQCRRAPPKRVLPFRALDVLDHLLHRRLSDVQVRVTLEVMSLDFTRFGHGSSGCWRLSSPWLRKGEPLLSAHRWWRSSSPGTTAPALASRSGWPRPAPTPTFRVEEAARGRSSPPAGAGRRQRLPVASRTARSFSPQPRLPRHRDRHSRRRFFSTERALDRPRVDLHRK